MQRGARKHLVGSIGLVALIGVSGCSHYLYSERAAWRHDAELACLNSGSVQALPGRVRMTAISGPGACGIDFPLKVSLIGEAGPLSYDDAPPLPPGAVPQAEQPRWPLAQGAGADQVPPPASYTPLPPSDIPQRQSSQYPGYAAAPPARYDTPPGTMPPPATSGAAGVDAGAAAAQAPVGLRPAATLACPIVSALDKWIAGAVQPAAVKWFGQRVVEIRQIGAYSCRGMNGNPDAHISEHAFGNALDIAEFDLADGRRISVQYGWTGTPREQGFLHDVQLSACREFTTVLAPGANVYHYNHIHVDLMRRDNRPFICEPAAIAGEVAAARAQPRYGAPQAYGRGDFTGSLARARAAVRADQEQLPPAVPGSD